jgi:hypothetical protein
MMSVPPQTMQAAQVLTGATMAAWLLAGFLPRHARPVRMLILTLYLVGVFGFVLYVSVG